MKLKSDYDLMMVDEIHDTTIPTRLSVMPGDRGFRIDARNFTVHLDSIEQSHCVIADSEKGYVVRYKRNHVGLLCKDRKGRFVTERVHGNVVIGRKP